MSVPNILNYMIRDVEQLSTIIYYSLMGESEKRDQLIISNIINHQIKLGKLDYYWRLLERYYRNYNEFVDIYTSENSYQKIYDRSGFLSGFVNNHIEINKKDFERYEEISNNLTWVMSTGRCGTLALHSFFSRSPEIFSVHRNFSYDEKFYSNYSAITTKSYVFNKFFNNSLDREELQRIIDSYLAKRMITIERAKNKKMIFCPHHDVAWLPIITQIFPHSKIIHLIRHPKQTIQSYLSKNQYTDRQIAPINFLNGYNLSFKSLVSLVCWYYTFINIYIKVHCNLIDSARTLFIKAEDLYQCNKGSYHQLVNFLDLNLSFDEFSANYSKSINKKSVSQQSKIQDGENWGSGLNSIYKKFLTPYITYLGYELDE